MTQIIVLVIDNFFNFKFNFWNLTLFGRLLKYIAIFWSQQVERLVFVGYSGDMREDIHQFVLRFVFHLFFFNSVQSLSRLWLFETQWTAPCQASLSITNSCSLLKLMSIESVLPSNHLILCCPLQSISKRQKNIGCQGLQGRVNGELLSAEFLPPCFSLGWWKSSRGE